MILKKRVVIYSVCHQKLDYILGCEKQYKFVKVLNDSRDGICYYRIPDWIDYPILVEAFVKGLEYTGLKVEREDYVY